MNFSRPLRLATIFFSALLTFASRAVGANVTWINPGTGNWVDGANWDTGAPPNSATADAALITNGGTAVIDATQNVSTGNVTLAGPAGTVGHLQMTGGSLTTTNTDFRIAGNGAATGGTATFTQSGGSVIMNAGNLNIGFGSAANGTYTLSDGSMQVNAGFIMAVGNVGRGTLNQTGGTIYIRTAGAPATSVIQLGRNSATLPASGTYTLSGGVAAANLFQFGRPGTAQTSGAQSTNTFNLQGTGKLITNAISLGNTPGFMTPIFNFTGGTLVATSIAMPLTNNGGTLSPDAPNFGVVGNVPATINDIPITEVATLTFSGDNPYTQTAAGILEIDLASAASRDFVDIGATGLASASISGTIAVNLLGGFDPPIGSVFDILAADTVTENATVTGLTPSGNTFDAITAVGGDGRQLVRLVVVPEPGTSALLALAAFGMAAQRRRSLPGL